jgi:hypothetical protein
MKADNGSTGGEIVPAFRGRLSQSRTLLREGMTEPISFRSQ